MGGWPSSFTMALLVSLGRFQAQRNGRGGGLWSPHEMYSEEIKLTELFLQNGRGYEIATKCVSRG